jgi:hypothetical protein
MHDQGPLQPPKENGDMALLIGCVEEAKQFNDRYLTEVIDDERKQQSQKQEKHSAKRTKTEIH